MPQAKGLLFLSPTRRKIKNYPANLGIWSVKFPWAKLMSGFRPMGALLAAFGPVIVGFKKFGRKCNRVRK